MIVDCDTRDEAVWRIVMRPHRPGEVPALSAQGLQRLREVLREADADDRCRVLVLAGTADGFCSGLDLERVAEAEAIEAGIESFAAAVSELRACPRAVVAAVDGSALGGGLGIAAAADLLLATRSSRFGLPEAVFGLVPAIVLPILLRRLPAQKVVRLSIAAEAVSAEEALAIGLVDRLVGDAGELEGAVAGAVRQLLRLHPDAVARLKRLVDELPLLDVDAGIAAGLVETRAALARADVAAGIAAFVDGQVPPWFARYRARGES